MSSSPGESHHGGKPRALAPSMKARRAIFDEEPSPAGQGATAAAKSFQQHLRDTPPAELPTAVKAGLYAVAVIVGLLLLVSLFRMLQPRKAESEPRLQQNAALTATSRRFA
jgi:hypothetical protein